MIPEYLRWSDHRTDERKFRNESRKTRPAGAYAGLADSQRQETSPPHGAALPPQKENRAQDPRHEEDEPYLQERRKRNIPVLLDTRAARPAHPSTEDINCTV